MVESLPVFTGHSLSTDTDPPSRAGGAQPDIQAYACELGITSALIANRGLVVCEEACELEWVALAPDGREHFLIPAAAKAWRLLHAAAQADGIDLFIVSAFRSVERQAEIVRRKLASGQSLETILAVSAPPGFSEHHSGRAVDLCTPGVAPLEPAFDQSPAFAWLVQRARAFGFRLSFPEGNAQGYQYEPWHWCFEAP